MKISRTMKISTAQHDKRLCLECGSNQACNKSEESAKTDIQYAHNCLQLCSSSRSLQKPFWTTTPPKRPPKQRQHHNINALTCVHVRRGECCLQGTQRSFSTWGCSIERKMNANRSTATGYRYACRQTSQHHPLHHAIRVNTSGTYQIQ